MDARAALKNLAAWRAANDEDRVTVLVELATSLGSGWRAGRTAVGRLGLGELLRRDLGLSFVVVPGGWLRMGFSADDLCAAAHGRKELAPRPVWGGSVTAARPTRWVRMRPYLLALTGLPAAPGEASSDGGRATQAYKAAVDAAIGDAASGPSAEELVKAYEGGPPDEGAAEPAMRTFAADEIAAAIPEGFRLPSEAELEWALREGGTTRWIGVAGDVEVTAQNRRDVLLGDLVNGFGLLGLRDLQNPCADGAVDYDVASPTDQHARATDREPRIARWAHTYWQDDDGEMIAMHAACRAAPDEYGDTIVRVAHDLPGLTGDGDGDGDGDGPPGPLAEHATVIAALTGDESRRRDEALCALAHLAIGPGHDTADTATAVIEALPRIAPAARAHALAWLADVQVGGHFALTIQRPERKRRHELGEDRAAVRAAVAAATAPIVEQLDDGDADVRSAAALALAFTVDAPAEAKAALGRRLARETEPGVQAMLILACVRLGTGFRPPAPEPVIQAAIAIATAFDGPPNVEALIAATSVGQTPHLAFGRGNLGNVAIGILRTLSPEVQAEAAVAIAARAAAERDRGLALVACEMAFGKPDRATPPRLIDELSSSQRQVVNRMADLDVELDWLGFGLPPTVTARRRYLSIDPDGPTDRFVAHGPDAEVPLWYALRSKLVADGVEAAQAELTRLVARLPILDQLAIYLDRSAHALDDVFAKVTLDGLLAAAGTDPAGLRAAVDALVAAPHSGPRGPELVRAVAATRPGEELPEALLAEIDGTTLGYELDVLRGFRPAAIARHLNAALQPALDRALAGDGWQLGLERHLKRWADVLTIAPSPMATRRLLLLGWASGQPAAVRDAVGKAAKGQSTLEPILVEYDGLPQFPSWPAAKAAMAKYGE